MKKLLFIVFLFINSTCNDFLDTWEGYVIPQGEHPSHRSGMPSRIINLKDGRHLLFDAKFLPSCLYDPQNDDINKLYGFTDCNSEVHENSTRFGWRTNKDQRIEIFAYWYTDGQLGFQSMGFTSPNKIDQYEIWAKVDFYYFRFNQTEFTTVRTKNCVHGIRVRLYPYFGGDLRAPHQMEFEIYEYD